MDSVSGAVGIIAGFRNALVGQSPLNVEAIWERIRTSGIFGGAQAGQYVFHVRPLCQAPGVFAHRP